RARALGIFQGATAAGASAGIVFGGILTEYAGWRGIFLVNPPVIAVLIGAMIRLLPREAGPRRAGTGPRGGPPGAGGAGAGLGPVSVAALIYGLSQGQQHGFAAPTTLVALVATVVLAAAFVTVERRVPVPMVPVRVLAGPARRAALGAMFLVASVVVGY